MTYIPNSIERLTPIVGYDPYAFIMDKPSNLQINKMQTPYDVDYYAKGPSDCSAKECPSGKKSVWKKVLNIGLGLAALGLGIYGISRGVAARRAAGGAGGAHRPSLRGICGRIRTATAPACTWVRNRLAQFGTFLVNRFGSTGGGGGTP